MQIRRDLTKSDIFKLGDEITIFSRYLDIPERDIIHCIETGYLMESPIRATDNDASAGFKYNNKGKLKLRDFGGYFWGDCFDAIAFVLNLNVNNKHDFRLILNHAYETLSSKNTNKVLTTRVNQSILKKARQQKRIIEIETREWNVHDRYYWNDFLYRERDILEYVQADDIFPIQHYWIDRHSQPSPKYYYKGSNPGYAYFFGHDDKGIANYRLYFPYNKKPFPKFITNNSSWQGLNSLCYDLDLLIITKSYKDRLSILSFTRYSKLKIGVIAPPSENHVISQLEYEWLASHVKRKYLNGNPAIISLYDFDKTGLNGSGYLKRTYGVPRVMFTNGTYGTTNIGNKDFTETIPVYGKQKFHSLVNEYLNKIELI